MFRLHDFVFLFWFLCFFCISYIQLERVSVLHGKEAGVPDGTVTAYAYKVTKDNLIVATIQGETYRIRLQGIEVFTEPDAKRFLKEKVSGQQIELDYDEQPFEGEGKITAYVWLGNEMVNRTLLSEGYARAAPSPQQTRYIKDFEHWQKKADQK